MVSEDVHDDEPEAYDGPLELRIEATTIMVEAHLSGFFQPIDGTYRWQGRLQPDDDLTALADSVGRGQIEAGLPGGLGVPAKLGEENPWGGYRIHGRGRPPFP